MPETLRPAPSGAQEAFKRSRNGCLTCKVRKKKCKEDRPVCSDCKRLNKECIWIDYETMDEEEIARLRKKAQEDESSSKIRKRRPKVQVPAETIVDIKRPLVKSPQHTVTHVLDPVDFGGQFQTEVHLGGITIQKRKPSVPSPYHMENGFEPVKQPKLETLPPPLDLEYYRDIDGKDPLSPSVFLNFLRDLSQHQLSQERLPEAVESPKISDLVPAFNTSLSGQTPDQFSPPFPISPNFSITSYLENIANNKSPQLASLLASSLNAEFLPAPLPGLSIHPDLDADAMFLYNYYVDTLSRKVSIAPISQGESNSYQKVFLPLAHRDKGVLYGILAWSGFHLGGQWQREGLKYVDKALDHVNQSLIELKRKKDAHTAGEIDKVLSKTESRQSILNKLATLLILCGAEICRGDVKNWSVYLSWGWKILYLNGGILNFNLNKEEHWLISNFAYHDILSSSTSERGTYFSPTTYDIIFDDPMGVARGNLNPLLGILKKLYKLIGDIYTLVYESRKSLKQYYSQTAKVEEYGAGVSTSPPSPTHDDGEDDELSTHGRLGKVLSTIIDKAMVVEKQIYEAKPDPRDLENLTDEDLELQLTLFEAFQLSGRLFLRQALLKFNPSTLESQVLANDLIKCIDILLETTAQASLVFPVFMAGIHCINETDRHLMKLRTDKFMQLYGPWNVVRVRHLMEKVWELNPDGDKVVDWLVILKELNWDINFA